MEGRTVLSPRSLSRPDELPDAPLILDATVTEAKIDALFGTSPVVEGDEPVALSHAHVTQIVDGQYHAHTIKTSETAQQKMQAAIDKYADLFERPLFIARQDILEADLFEFPDHGVIRYYHALRGLNFGGCDAVMCIGAPHPRMAALQRDADLLAMHRDDLTVGGTEWSDRRTEDGALAAKPPVYRKLVYEDETGAGRAVRAKHFTGLVGALFREAREKELEQGVHRIRPLLADADEPKHVCLLTSVPTALPVDDLRTFEEFTEPVRAYLPVPDGALDLLDAIHDVQEGDGPPGFRATSLLDRDGETVAFDKRAVHRLATLTGLDVTYMTISRWVNALNDVGILAAGEYERGSGVRFSTDAATLTSALQVVRSNTDVNLHALRRFRRAVQAADGTLTWLAWAREALGLGGDRCEWDPPPQPGG